MIHTTFSAPATVFVKSPQVVGNRQKPPKFVLPLPPMARINHGLRSSFKIKKTKR